MLKQNLIFGSGASAIKDEKGLYTVCSAAIENGIRAFDTAPSYKTEIILARVLHKIAAERQLAREDLYIQTKIDPIQMYERNVCVYFQKKLKDMRLNYVDALLIHWPVKRYFRDTWKALLFLKGQGLVKNIGISNLRLQHLKELKCLGVIPDILQIERHPLNTFQEEIKFCHEYNIKVQDYSPLCKMHPLVKNNKKLEELSTKYNRSVGQIILRWHIDTGATPVFTSKRIYRIEEYSHLNEFKLEPSDIDIINNMNINHKLYLESLICPGF